MLNEAVVHDGRCCSNSLEAMLADFPQLFSTDYATRAGDRTERYGIRQERKYGVGLNENVTSYELRMQHTERNTEAL